MTKIRESSNIEITNEEGKTVKGGFVDINDAQEWTINNLEEKGQRFTIIQKIDIFRTE